MAQCCCQSPADSWSYWTKTRTEPQAPQSFFDRLRKHEITRLTLTFDYQQLSDKKYSSEYFPATISYGNEHWDADLRIRGRYRRRVCSFPPLRIKLSKSMLRAAGLEGHNKFKLVTHCSDDFDYRNNVLREQLTYELYRLVTGQGFRTQLVEVTYRDARTGDAFQRLAILIEDTDEMAAAHAGEECDDCVALGAEQFVAGNPETVALFNYMIGNSDWSAKMQRNVKIVQQQAGGKHILVPYDFDFAALVGVEYAVPNPNFDQVNIKDRVWIWEFETPPVHLDRVLGHFQSKETAVLQYVENFPELDQRTKRQITKYLTGFFQELRDGTFQSSI